MTHSERRTLDFWRDKLAQLPRTIECREMRLLGRDSEPDVVIGPGRIEIRSETEIRFFMYGVAADNNVAFRKLVSAQNNPYDTLEQFRLVAVDYSGVEWAGGWMQVDFFSDVKGGWPLTGELTSTPSRSYCRVKPLKLNPSLFGGELPIRFDMHLVAAVLPGGDFVNQRLLVRDTPVEALG